MREMIQRYSRIGTGLLFVLIAAVPVVVAGTIFWSKPQRDTELYFGVFLAFAGSVTTLVFVRDFFRGVPVPPWRDEDDAALEDPESQPAPITGLRWHDYFVALLLVAALVALAALVLKHVPGWLQIDGDSKEAAVERSGARTAGLAAIAGLGAALGLLLSYAGHRNKIEETRALERDRSRTARREQRAKLAQRFNDAVKLLAEGAPGKDDDRQSLRVAGIYSLGGVAFEDARQRAVVRDVLAAFVAPHISGVRMAQSVYPPEALEEITPAARDYVAAMVVLARIAGADQVPYIPRWPFGPADLTGANLRGADLRGTDLRGARLAGADLRQTDLSWAELADADLEGADLRESRLLGCRLQDSVLRHVDLRGAHLVESRISGASLRGARLDGAHVEAGWGDLAADRDIDSLPSYVWMDVEQYGDWVIAGEPSLWAFPGLGSTERWASRDEDE